MDPADLGRLLDRHARVLELYARQWCSQPEDIVQEAFVSLSRRSRESTAAPRDCWFTADPAGCQSISLAWIRPPQMGEHLLPKNLRGIWVCSPIFSSSFPISLFLVESGAGRSAVRRDGSLTICLLVAHLRSGAGSRRLGAALAACSAGALWQSGES